MLRVNLIISVNRFQIFTWGNHVADECHFLYTSHFCSVLAKDTEYLIFLVQL